MDYKAPIDQLLRIGDVRKLQEDINYVERFDLNDTHIPELILVMNDEALNRGDPESAEVWGPVHAWRALGQLDVGKAIVAMLERMLEHPLDDDWLHDDLRELIGHSGQAYIPKVADLIAEHADGSFPAITLVAAIGELGKNHPEVRDECVDVLTKQLKKSAGNDQAVNGFLVSELLDLQAVESLGVIEAAYYLDHVDPTICGNLKDVYYRFGLEKGPPPPTPEEENLRMAARFHALQNADPGKLSELFPIFGKRKQKSAPKPRKKFGKKHKRKK